MDLKIHEQRETLYQGNEDCKGFIKIWSSDSNTGESKLLLEHRNTILYQGADLLAAALTGQANAKITHFYLGYNNASSFTPVAVDKANSQFKIDSDYNYLKIPLTFPATFLKEPNYENNIPVFTVLLSNPNDYRVGLTPSFNSSSKMFEVGLVAALVTGSNTGDKVFARAQFTNITYDSTHNLTISWGIKFTA